ncbi:amidase [Bacillus shivajii]|uniref:amidase n=1 Tax=Bacillus shivajii TaxID=1983719 RepID=UPI001CFC0E79|nr:amidase [Bacillus shivajii]UCZ53904.1 amidase [Bacillus shivajii]
MGVEEAGIKNELLDLDARTIAMLIKEKKISSVEVVKAYINHIKRVNPNINALVEDRFNIALEEAKQKDFQLQNGETTGMLHGVPISVKESLHVSGMISSGGMVDLKNNKATEDALVVERLKKEGAIILGKTNTPELCFCQETENKLYGKTNNPWDVTKTAGGSSGGEAALLATGGAAVGIGSDIGGSIRFPSHFNGVVGFKPGMFRVSQKGHFPFVTHPLQQRMIGIGPIGKSVSDMEKMYEIISDHKPKSKDLTDFTIEMLPKETGYPLSAATDTILSSVEGTVRKSFTVTKNIPPYFKESGQVWQEIMSINGGEEMKNIIFHNQKPRIFSTYIKERITKKTNMHAYLSWALIGANIFKPSESRLEQINEMIKVGDEQITDYLQNRLLIYPVYYSGAKKHGSVYKELFSFRKTFLTYMPYIAYANVWGLPSLVVPAGTDEHGMPVSIQIISGNENEFALFQLGKLIEQKHRGYVRCKC